MFYTSFGKDGSKLVPEETETSGKSLHTEDSVSNTHNLEKYVYMNGRLAFAMIDLGASGNFISKRLVDKFGTRIGLKSDPYDLMVIDESSLLSDDG